MANAYQNLYTIEQIHQLERLAIEIHGIDESTLMDRAGQAVCHILFQYWPDSKHFVVVCAKGNNAGDGYTAARYINYHGRYAKVLQLDSQAKLKGAALKAYQECEASGCTINPFSEEALDEADVIVDALLGIGLKGEVREPIASAIEAINHCKRPVLAIDGPSGLDAERGVPLGQAIQASVTVSMIGAKCGFFTGAGLTCSGNVVTDALDIPESTLNQITPEAYLMTQKACTQLLPPRPRHAHKGSFGRILILGGDKGMAGAVRMAGEAALRAGAGMVKVVTRPEHLDVVSVGRPELMCFGIQQGDSLDNLLEWADVIALGPGLGQSEWSKALFNRILPNEKPKVIDADGLNLLAHSSRNTQKHLLKGPCLLTPHPGEAARLLNTDSKTIQNDRFQAAKALSECFESTILLKGAGSIIADSNQLTVVTTGNPGMASAGMGDVLTGVFVAMLGQKLSVADTAKCGTFCHGLAGDIASKQYQQERGLLALDVASCLPQAVNPKPYQIKGLYE